MTYFFVFCHSERSEESHNLSEEYILRTFSVGYFACAQYDVLFAFPEGESEVGFTVFAREHSDRGKLPGGWFSAKYIFRTFSVGYFACAQYDVLFAFPEGESEVGFTVFAREHSDRGKLPGGWFSAKYIFRTFSVRYFANAQYDVLFAFSFGESGLQAQRSKTIGDKSVR